MSGAEPARTRHRLRRAAALVVAVVGFVSGGVPGGTVSAGVPDVQTCTADAALGIGSIGPSVSCLQFALVLEGLYAGPLTGRFDEATGQAVAWYQIQHPPLPANGVADAYTLTFLGIFSGVINPAPAPCLADATLRSGQRGESVACMQHALIREGLYADSVTGLFDAPTKAAVQQFQRNQRLKADGVAGPQTLAAMGIWSGLTVKPGVRTGAGPFPAPMQDLPNWNLTKAGIPYYGFGTACTASEAAVIAAEFAVDGADAATQQWAVYIASREGGCRFDALNLNLATQDESYCTFQLNALSGMFTPTGALGRRGWTTDAVTTSLVACADAASDLWAACGRGPWTKPYSCIAPFAGATVNQPPPVLPPLTDPSTTTTTTVPVAPPVSTPPDDPTTTTTTTTTTTDPTATTSP